MPEPVNFLANYIGYNTVQKCWATIHFMLPGKWEINSGLLKYTNKNGITISKAKTEFYNCNKVDILYDHHYSPTQPKLS